MSVPHSLPTARNVLRTLFAAVAIIGLSGCSTFNRDWKAAAAAPQGEGIEGAWKGSWLSDHNGHNGGLRAIITRKDESTYHARFHATYKRILGFGQAVDLVVNRDGTNYTFSGRANLGKAHGGDYTYEGNASPEGFRSTYNCSIDHGTFRMARP